VVATDPLEKEAEDWIAPYWNADHLRRARDWLVCLEPGASSALRLAALTHDIERHFPGGPTMSLANPPEHDRAYRDAHSRRSAELVASWLRERGASDALVAEVRGLVLLHECGGTPNADLVQAADSLSFLETNGALVESWVRENRCSAERAAAQLDWMFGRIQLEGARRLAEPLHADAVRRLSTSS
jgi:hypothetical protein